MNDKRYTLQDVNNHDLKALQYYIAGITEIEKSLDDISDFIVYAFGMNGQGSESDHVKAIKHEPEMVADDLVHNSGLFTHEELQSIGR